jgi:hypothetical protein
VPCCAARATPQPLGAPVPQEIKKKNIVLLKVALALANKTMMALDTTLRVFDMASYPANVGQTQIISRYIEKGLNVQEPSLYIDRSANANPIFEMTMRKFVSG